VEAPEAIKLAADSTSPRVYAIDVLWAIKHKRKKW
jgi:hypothetical protein